jgi:hypothetical protein
VGILESFLGAAIAGFAGLLLVVALLAWKRAGDRKMAVLGAAFGALAAGGVALLLGSVAGGEFERSASLALAVACFAGLVLLYGALFARRA